MNPGANATADNPAPAGGEPRRTFVKQLAAGAALAAWQTSGAGAAEGGAALGMAGIGCGGQGTSLIRSFASQPEVRMLMVCDPDLKRAESAAGEVEKISGRRPQVVQDLRRALESPEIGAVIVATPDHWHGPATLLALAAGKHVYVEKPCAHNLREGRWMVEAARRHGRVVQVGTQSRSLPHVRRALELVEGGAIGEVLVAKAWNSQLRGDIGRGQPGESPQGVDYDLWLGPAPEVPFQANRFHYSWHWWYDFGTGDMGNDGVHELDIARWGLGVDEHPSSVAAGGGKLFFDDDQQFPDTQYVLFDYPDGGGRGRRRQLVYEQRIWSPYTLEGHENGNAFYGTKGCLVLGKRSGWQLFGPRNELRDSMTASGSGAEHHRDFLEAIASGRRPRADIEIGHLSAALCHLGNIAVRSGGKLAFDPQSEQIVGHDEANRLLGRAYRPGHWAVPKSA